jgi:hypothetical protein
MMAETQARYPSQELPEGTPDMYLAQWERIAGKFGMVAFHAALLQTIEDRDRPRFFPDPLEIEDRIRAARREYDRQTSAQRAIREHDAAKLQWFRERAEDIAAGIERKPLTGALAEEYTAWQLVHSASSRG